MKLEAYQGRAARALLLGKGQTYIYLHLLIDAVVHNQAVRQPDSMRLHWMASHIGIITNIGVVEVSNSVLPS